MTKKEFLDQLFAALENVSATEKGQIDEYYTELLLDKIEEGFSEEEAVKSFGTPEEAAEMIMEDLKESRMELQVIGEEPKKTQPASDLLIEEPGITSFDIEVKNASVKIEPSSDNCFRVRYLREEGVEVECSRQGDCFVVREKDRDENGRGMWRRFVWGPTSEGELRVEIPEGKIRQFRLRTTNASARIRNIAIQETGTLGTTNDKIQIIGCEQGTFIGSTTNSKINLEDCKMDIIKVFTTNGKIAVGNCLLNHLSCETTNGRISVENLAADVIELSSTNGSLAGEIIGTQEDYNIKAHTTNGSCNLPNQINVASQKKLSAHTTNGSIKIDFTE